MIGPSDLYRVPLCVTATQREDLLRYARLEHRATDLSWSMPTSRPSTARWTGIRLWLSSRFGALRTSAPAAQPAALRSGLAAVHFGGETSERVREPRLDLETPRASGVLVASSLILTTQPSPSDRDEPCTCEQ